MWTTQIATEEEKKVLSWEDFPQDITSLKEINAPRIASYLRQLLESYEESEFIKYLIAPSPIALSGFFHCAETEIYQALTELQRQGYEAETSGNATPIILWDPLIRRKTTRREESPLWQHFYHMFIPIPTQTAVS